jgi:hypothetical protein
MSEQHWQQSIEKQKKSPFKAVSVSRDHRRGVLDPYTYSVMWRQSQPLRAAAGHWWRLVARPTSALPSAGQRAAAPMRPPATPFPGTARDEPPQTRGEVEMWIKRLNSNAVPLDLHDRTARLEALLFHTLTVACEELLTRTSPSRFPRSQRMRLELDEDAPDQDLHQRQQTQESSESDAFARDHASRRRFFRSLDAVDTDSIASSDAALPTLDLENHSSSCAQSVLSALTACVDIFREHSNGDARIVDLCWRVYLYTSHLLYAYIYVCRDT